MKSKQREVGVVRFYLNDCGLMGGSTVAGYSEELKMLNTYIHPVLKLERKLGNVKYFLERILARGESHTALTFALAVAERASNQRR